MGSTTYYQATMRARDLAAIAKLASELPQWTKWSVFERFQRELANNRVQDEIVPYLVKTRDRFFNSLIVLIFDPDQFEFEPFLPYTKQVPSAYRDAAEHMGFLTVDGGDLVVLDGQHRLSALRSVTVAGPELKGEYVHDVGDDELCVILIRHESFEKTRRIFNKVNRYAKPTSPTDNIITSEDDGSAIITRWLVEPDPPLGLSLRPPLNGTDSAGEPIVEWRKQSLNPDDEKFSTLAALYRITQVVLSANGVKGFDERHMVNRPSDNQLRKAYTVVAEWWNIVIAHFAPFRRCVTMPSLLPSHRAYQGRYSLLFRPLGQVAFAHALCGAQALGVSTADAADAASRRSWSASDSTFFSTVIHPNGT